MSWHVQSCTTRRSSVGRTAFLFDLDGTLVDSVYQHVLAWREAMAGVGIKLAVWRIHRRIGMSGGLMANAILRETGHVVTQRRSESPRAAPRRGLCAARPSKSARCRARENCWPTSRRSGVPWAIATSSRIDERQADDGGARHSGHVPIITRDQVEHAKPDPDLFLAAAERLGVPIGDSVVVGDSVWDLLAARRARAIGVGLMSGGYGEEELERAGAYRVYQDPADLLLHLDEVGVRAVE